MEVKLGLQGKASIEQSIRTILLTSPGSVPFRPSFGVGSENLLGSNIGRNEVAIRMMEQLERYEPRIKVNKVIAKKSDLLSQLEVSILYTIIETGEQSGFFQAVA